jgi:phosphate/sulfate permease
MIMFLLIAIASIVVCFSSCKNKVKNDIVKVVAEWKDEEIKFPEGIPCFSMGEDTTCVDLYGDNCKIMLYVEIVGNQTLNSGIWTLFKKIITEKESNKQSPRKKDGESAASAKENELLSRFSPKKKGGAFT